MLFNEQEMIALCNEMNIELIDNDGNTKPPVVDSSLFNDNFYREMTDDEQRIYNNSLKSNSQKTGVKLF